MFLLARVLWHKATELPWQYYEYRGYSRLTDITSEDNFLCLCDQKAHIKTSDCGQLQSYSCLKLRIQGMDY